MEIKEKISIIWRKIKANVDRSTFVLFFLLLILMCGIYGYEVTRPEPSEEPTAGEGLPEHFPNDNYNKCMSYINSNTDLEKDEELKIIKYFNIFDYKYVRDKNELQKEADKNFTRALKLYEEGKSDDAMKILKDILLTWPSHLSSRELVGKIEASKATPTPTPTPKRPMPGVPEMGEVF